MQIFRAFSGIIFTVVFSAANLLAQPTLTSLQLPQPGDLVVQDWMNSVPPQANAGGPNQTWDYSQNTFNSVEDSGRYVNMLSSVQGWNYNLGYRFITPNQPKFEFYQLASNSLYYAGYARSDIAIDTLILTATSFVLPVPLTYLDSMVRPLGGRYVNNGFPIQVSGSSRLKADGYGTVILPGGTYNNVLRVHVLDTISFFGQNNVNSVYYYYATGERYPLLVIFDNSTPQGYTTRIGVPTAVEDAQSPPAPQIYPNPATDRLYIATQAYTHAALEVGLYDLSGQRLQHWQFRPGSGYETIVLHLENVAAGMYVLQISDGTSAIHRKKIYLTGQ